MQGGDDVRLAFESEVLPHLDAAYRVALSLTRHEADAEDLVQDACLRAYRGFGGFRRGTNARAWLLTILRRTFLNDRRRERARPRPVPLTVPGDSSSPIEPVDADAPGPEEHVIRGIEREQLMLALAGLPEPFRSAVSLVDLAELRYAEAARVLDCPVGTVMSRLHRGRLLLAEALGITGNHAGEGAAATAVLAATVQSGGPRG